MLVCFVMMRGLRGECARFLTLMADSLSYKEHVRCGWLRFEQVP